LLTRRRSGASSRGRYRRYRSVRDGVCQKGHQGRVLVAPGSGGTDHYAEELYGLERCTRH